MQHFIPHKILCNHGNLPFLVRRNQSPGPEIFSPPHIISGCSGRKSQNFRIYYVFLTFSTPSANRMKRYILQFFQLGNTVTVPTTITIYHLMLMYNLVCFSRRTKLTIYDLPVHNRAAKVSTALSKLLCWHWRAEIYTYTCTWTLQQGLMSSFIYTDMLMYADTFTMYSMHRYICCSNIRLIPKQL